MAFDHSSKKIGNTEIKCRRFELDLPAHDLRPLVPRGVDPADEVEVVHALERAQVRALSTWHVRREMGETSSHEGTERWSPEAVREKGVERLRTHLADWSETRPSFGPSFSYTTECGHL